MTNATQGRRPTGPGEYTYEGRTVIVEERLTNWDEYELAAYWIHPYPDGADVAWHFVSAMPGTFTPLSPPVAAPEPLRESLAAVSHAIWAHWMRYLFDVSVKCDDGSVIILSDHAQRWQRQMETDYDDLTEREKESDRHQADKILAVLPTHDVAPQTGGAE